MAHLWQPDETADGGWTPVPLAPNTSLAGGLASFSIARTPEGETWVLLAEPTPGEASVRVNGTPLAIGIAALRDRDEVMAGGARAFFSTERLATITTFEGAECAVFCPRCKLEIAPGTPVVRCPTCGILHHQSDDYGCWTYAERCAMCDQRTALDTGYRWTPEGL
jgi:hypothetical protein